MKVPFIDLHRQYLSIKPDIDKSINQVFEASQFIGGNYVTQFENEFAQYCGIDYCVGCANGTDAIELALRALGIGEGDEVIVPAFTWISDADAVRSLGAKVIFADILKDEYTIDPEDVKSKTSSKTKAVIAVHLYGHSCRMTELEDVLKNTKIHLIEDCAQAHGATYKGKMIGQFGVISTYSFYPSKNLGAFGDAGAVLTNNKELSDKVRLLSNHGQFVHNEHLLQGQNSRLDTLQASMLSAKLPYLNKWNARRREIAQLYFRGLKDIISIKIDLENDVFHLFVVRIKNRDHFKRQLEEMGIMTSIHYPKALPDIIPYYDRDHSCKSAKEVASEVLSLPIYPELTDDEVGFVITNIRLLLQS
jgi:dTDP-4-amino-4,6-dideoxygalactose transaminase